MDDILEKLKLLKKEIDDAKSTLNRDLGRRSEIEKRILALTETKNIKHAQGILTKKESQLKELRDSIREQFSELEENYEW